MDGRFYIHEEHLARATGKTRSGMPTCCWSIWLTAGSLIEGSELPDRVRWNWRTSDATAASGHWPRHRHSGAECRRGELLVRFYDQMK